MNGSRWVIRYLRAISWLAFYRLDMALRAHTGPTRRRASYQLSLPPSGEVSYSSHTNGPTRDLSIASSCPLRPLDLRAAHYALSRQSVEVLARRASSQRPRHASHYISLLLPLSIRHQTEQSARSRVPPHHVYAALIPHSPSLSRALHSAGRRQRAPVNRTAARGRH